MTISDMSRHAKRVRDEGEEASLKTSRSWCATIYIRGDGTLQPANDPQAAWRYAIGQLEECPETGRLHWQVYVEYNTPVRRASVCSDFDVVQAGGERRVLTKREFHGERRFGSREQARDYCRKADTHVPGDGNRFERGSFCNSLCFWTYGVYDWHTTPGDPCWECRARDITWHEQLAIWELVSTGAAAELPCRVHEVESAEWPYLTLIGQTSNNCNCRVVTKTKL